MLILMGSPRLHDNTAELCLPSLREHWKFSRMKGFSFTKRLPLMDELMANGAQVRYLTLADGNIGTCRECYACRSVEGAYSCCQQDGMPAADTLRADLIVSDRCCGFNKYYASAVGSLWAGRKVTIPAALGYERAYATEPFETGVQRLCGHSGLEYIGMCSVQNDEDIRSFRRAAAIGGAREYARKVLT